MGAGAGRGSVRDPDRILMRSSPPFIRVHIYPYSIFWSARAISDEGVESFQIPVSGIGKDVYVHRNFRISDSRVSEIPVVDLNPRSSARFQVNVLPLASRGVIAEEGKEAEQGKKAENTFHVCDAISSQRIEVNMSQLATQVILPSPAFLIRRAALQWARASLPRVQDRLILLRAGSSRA
jgi:hypothetical protein